MNKAINPEDLLADNVNTLTMNGSTIRKGTFAAMMANIEILEQPALSTELKATVLAKIEELAPILIGVGFNNVATWKNPDVRHIFERLEN